MSLLLLFRRQRVSSNAGHAETPVVEALGAGHVVVEELSGQADLRVVQALGSGRLVLRPGRVESVGRRPFPQQLRGKGRASHPASSGIGSGRLLHAPLHGAGRARLLPVGSIGAGRLTFPTFVGVGTAAIEALQAFGVGLLKLPELPPAPVMQAQVQPCARPWEAEQDAPQQTHRRRRTRPAQVAFDDDEDALLLLMELLK